MKQLIGNIAVSTVLASLGMIAYENVAIAESAYTFGKIEDGSPGTCPDCIGVYVELGAERALEISVDVEETMSFVLCSLKVHVEQDGVVLYDGPAPLEEPLPLEEGT